MSWALVRLRRWAYIFGQRQEHTIYGRQVLWRPCSNTRCCSYALSSADELSCVAQAWSGLQSSAAYIGKRPTALPAQLNCPAADLLVLGARVF